MILYETDRHTLMAATYSVTNGSFVAGKAREWSHGVIGREVVAVCPSSRLWYNATAERSSMKRTAVHSALLLI